MVGEAANDDKTPGRRNPDRWKRLWIIADSTLSSRQRLLLHTLAIYLNGKETCWPSVPAIAASMGLKDRQAQELMQQLRDLGIVVTQRRGQGKTNLIEVKWDQIPVRDDARKPADLDAQFSEDDARKPADLDARVSAPRTYKTKTEIKNDVTEGSNWRRLQVRKGDLSNPEMMFRHFTTAVKAKLIDDTPDNRIAWMTLAAYVLEESRNGRSRSPAGLFVSQAKSGEFMRVKDLEEKATKWLTTKQLLYAPIAERTKHSGPTPVGTALAAVLDLTAAPTTERPNASPIG